LPLSFTSTTDSSAQAHDTLDVNAPDFYGFTVTTTGALVATATPTDGTVLLPRLLLYGSAGQLLIQADAAGPLSAAARLSQHLRPGTYYLSVSAANDPVSPTGDRSYLLSADFGPALPPLQPVGVGLFPQSVAVGDFRHDGILDIVTADSFDSTVSVALGRGDGTFLPRVAYPTFATGVFDGGTGPLAVAVGDFRHDGILDIVTADQIDDTVSVLLGNGDGTFRLDATYPVGSEPTAVAVGDFRGDGILDIITANADGTVSVLPGNGDGTFGTAGSFPISGGGTSVTVGDFRNNGELDIATAGDDGTVSVLLGNGDDTFQPAVVYPVSDYLVTVAAGRFDGDGTLDLMGLDSGGAAWVLPGAGDGTFLPGLASAAATDPASAVVGDFNGDGRLDLAAANSDNTVSVALGRGDGRFAPPVSYGVGGTPASVAAGDFNGDGHPDLVAANSADNTVSLLLGRGDGSFLTHAASSVGKNPFGLTVANLAGDGHPGIVTANDDGTVSVLLGRGDGTFRPAATYTVGGNPFSVAAGDFNGDGAPDLVIGDALNHAVSVLLGRGDGTFLPPVSYDVGNPAKYVAVGDFDHDGHLDIAAAGVDTVSILRGRGDGTFLAPIFYGVPDGAGALAVADFNGDGNLDLATAGGATVSVLSGRGDGTFDPAISYPVGNEPFAIVVGDFNHDGAPDLATANIADNTISVLLNRNDGTFLPAVSSHVGLDPTGLAAADFDGDGNLDLVAANSNDDSISVLRGRTDGTFQPAVSFPVGGGPDSVAVGDFNGDGRSDIATANGTDNTVSVLLGKGDGRFQATTPQSGIALRSVPYLRDFDGDGTPDSLILDGSGHLLFRRGLAGAGNRFAPPVVINLGHAARDAVPFRTAAGWAVAAADAAGNEASVYTWSAASHSFQRTTAFATGNLPVRVAAADLNGDGLDDLVVANDFDRSVTIALQTPAGTFAAPVTRPVGVGPSDIAVADFGGTSGPDVVVSDQVSGDFTVLRNDPTHSFEEESRYRAGSGLFDIAVDPGTGEQTVSSEQQTVGIAADDFTGSGRADLAVLNRGDRTFTLFPDLDRGRFTDPLAANTYFTSDQPGQVASLTLPGDALPSVAILMEDLSQVWIYRNHGDGTFDPPTKVAAGQGARGFSVATVQGRPALLVGNAFGDILTLLYDGSGSFAPDRTDLQGMPLAVGTIPGTGQQYAVVADQRLDRVAVYYRTPGTNRLGGPVPIDSGTQPLLAPGAVQLFAVPGDPEPYLVVANSLSNNVLVYHGLGGGEFTLPTAYAVGVNPVAVTVADLNGDGVPDLAVANNGSDDVSVLIGGIDPSTGTWTATPYQRLNSHGSGPISVAVRNTGGSNGPDLLVTNSDGQVIDLPGIGSGGKGSGFFQDTAARPVSLGGPVVQLSFDPGSGRLFALGADGSVSVLAGDRLTSLIGGGATALDEVGGVLAAGFADGSVELFSAAGALLASEPTGLGEQPSALRVLENGNDVDVYLTARGSDVPVIVSFAFIPVVLELPPSAPVALGTGVPGADLLLVATLVSPGLTEAPPTRPATITSGGEGLTLFLPAGTVAEGPGAVSLAGGGGTEQVPGGRGVEEPTRDHGSAGWEVYPLGAAEALRQRVQRREAAERARELLETVRQLLNELRPWLAIPRTTTDVPQVQAQPEEIPFRAGVGEDRPVQAVEEESASAPGWGCGVAAVCVVGTALLIAQPRTRRPRLAGPRR
jgi:WD40 repeat protein